MITTLYRLAATWTALGLLSGLAYREITRSHDFTDRTQLAFAHTHLLALGTLMTLTLLILERVFALSTSRWFRPGLWTYTAGVAVTVTMLIVNGVRTVYGHASTAAYAGVSGLGHITVTVGFVLLFLALGDAVRQVPGRSGPAAEQT